jgi:hypothetical protein
MLKQVVNLGIPALLLAITQPSFGQALSLGLNFGADEPPGVGSALGASTVAGAVAQQNWNNLTGASGSATAPVVDLGGAAIPTSVAVTWTCPNTWSSTGRGEENNGLVAGGDKTLMTGYLDTGDTAANSARVTVSGLSSSFTSAGYDVYVYFLGGVGGRGGAYTIGSTTKIGTAMANPTVHVEDLGVDMQDAGTYVRFAGLTDASFTLTSDASAPLGNFRAPINAIQVVAVPEPSTIAFLALTGLGLAVYLRRRS